MRTNSRSTSHNKSNKRKSSSATHLKLSMSQKDFIQPGPLPPEDPISNFTVVQTEYLTNLFSAKKVPLKRNYNPKSEYKIRRDLPFKKISETDMSSMNDLIIDDYDKKVFEQISPFTIPSIKDLIPKVKISEVKEEYLSLFSFIAYIMYTKRSKEIAFAKTQFLSLFPIEKITLLTDKKDRGVLNMMLNCIIFCIDNEDNAKSIISNILFKTFKSNLYTILTRTKHYRIKRKVTALLSLLLFYNNDFIISDFNRFHTILDQINFGSVIVIKLYHLLKEKQNTLIDSIIFSNDVNGLSTIKSLNILINLMDVSESELIYEEKKYRELFRFISLSLGIKTSILCKVRELKKKIRDLI